MPVGTITLAVIAVLIYFGVVQRVLDRLGLTDRAALLWIAAIVVGSYIDVPLVGGRNRLVLNIGGGLVPLALVTFIIYRADEQVERVRAATAILLTTGIMYGLGRIMPDEPTEMVFMDPLYIFALVGGMVAYLLGRSRRAAFAAGTLGIILVDLVHYFVGLSQGIRGTAWIGGAGAFDASIVAGVGALLVAELVGESREHLYRSSGEGASDESTK
jgi:uncharacterized membrane protein